ncbi:MAG: class I SAM-dependent methyltransferase [Candidatus Scalindua sp.]|nr:class I SAM-dependent methyltransferase [Candidatus Scalindua sp.]
MKDKSEALYESWDRRWEGSEESERITFVGRIMFNAKKNVIAKVIHKLPIKTVMEVGCGLGHTMEVFREQGFYCKGVDVSPHAVSVCKQKGLNVSLQKLEDITGQYDLVSSDGMLEHFLHFEPYARMLMGVSRNYVLLIQPNHDSFWGKTLAYLAEMIRGDENVFEYNYRVQDFIGIFNRNGFEVVDNYPVFFDVFRLLLFRKR